MGWRQYAVSTWERLSFGLLRGLPPLFAFKGMTTKALSKTAAALVLLVVQSCPVLAQSTPAGETLHIARTTGAIKIDGNLSDEGWQDVKPLTTWYEVNPGDTTPPRLRN